MVFGCECIPHLSPMTHNEQDTHESFGVALIMVMSFVDLSSPKSPLAFVVTVNDCAFKIVILLLVSLSSLLNTPRKMHKSKLSQNFYTIGRNNESGSLLRTLKPLPVIYNNAAVVSEAPIIKKDGALNVHVFVSLGRK